MSDSPSNSTSQDSGRIHDDPVQILDVRGLLCPMPVIRTQERVSEMHHGSELVVQATDPGTLHDVPAWCRVHGHELIETQRRAGEVSVRLRVIRSAP